VSSIEVLGARIRDRLSLDWLTPSQLVVWEALHRFDGPPHRVISVYGAEGTGKTFFGWLLEREGYSTYGKWSERSQPVLPRLTLDNARSRRDATRELRPLVDRLGIQQIILLSRTRVDEPALPAFELRVTSEDLEHFRANLFRHLRITLPDGNYHNYTIALAMLG
jgi:hypothetical protein